MVAVEVFKSDKKRILSQSLELGSQRIRNLSLYLSMGMSGIKSMPDHGYSLALKLGVSLNDL